MSVRSSQRTIHGVLTLAVTTALAVMVALALGASSAGAHGGHGHHGHHPNPYQEPTVSIYLSPFCYCRNFTVKPIIRGGTATSMKAWVGYTKYSGTQIANLTSPPWQFPVKMQWLNRGRGYWLKVETKFSSGVTVTTYDYFRTCGYFFFF